MASLTNDQKAFIVKAFARYDTVSEVCANFAGRFGFELPPAQALAYNIGGGSFRGAQSSKWVEMFHEARKAFLSDTEHIGIANKVVRLQRLERMCALALTRKNIKLAAELMEQAAKEMGEVFTNRREVRSDVRSVTATMTTDELRQAIASDLKELGIDAAPLQIGLVRDDTKH